jgi:hypothetical protein
MVVNIRRYCNLTKNMRLLDANQAYFGKNIAYLFQIISLGYSNTIVYADIA